MKLFIGDLIGINQNNKRIEMKDLTRKQFWIPCNDEEKMLLKMEALKNNLTLENLLRYKVFIKKQLS